MNPKSTTAFVTLAILSVVYCFLPTGDDTANTTADRESEFQPVAAMETPPVSALAVNNSINEVSKRTVRYLDASRGAELKGKDGTVLVFPPNCFVNENGDRVSGRIKIIIEEYYDLTGMLDADLSTSSGKKLLETAGMVNIQAYSGRENLDIAEGATYEIAFPKKGNTKNDFQLFYGARNEDGILDWRLAEEGGEVRQDEIVSSENTVFPDVENNCFIQITESRLRRGTRISNMDFFNWQLMNGQTLNQWFVGNFNPDLLMLEKYCREDLRTGITFHVNRKGEFQDYYISQTGHLEYDRVLAGFLSTMPPLKLDVLMPDYTDDHACMLVFSSREMSASESVVNDFARRHKNDKELSNVETSELDYYIYSSTSLGWINCDRFVPEEGELVDLKINAKGGNDAMVSMVFDDTNSILKARLEDGLFVFTGIPKAKDVRIIGVNNSGGKTSIAVLPCRTKDGTIDLDQYKNTSLQDLDLTFRPSANANAVAMR